MWQQAHSAGENVTQACEYDTCDAFDSNSAETGVPDGDLACSIN